MEQFKNMVEQKALFEWSPETCLALCTRFCSWVVPETEDEYDQSSTGTNNGAGKIRTNSRMNVLINKAIQDEQESKTPLPEMNNKKDLINVKN